MNSDNSKGDEYITPTNAKNNTNCSYKNQDLDIVRNLYASFLSYTNREYVFTGK